MQSVRPTHQTTTGGCARDENKSLNLAKSTLPRPVTGSQPVVASNPCEQHAADAVHLLSPWVISLKVPAAAAYRVGLMKPIEVPSCAFTMAAYLQPLEKTEKCHRLQ